jgi:hypothetical protein
LTTLVMWLIANPLSKLAPVQPARVGPCTR